jgi:hypothetical protein
VPSARMQTMRAEATQTPLKSARPCALVFSYHFAPSSEVAARRLAAFVSLLHTQGLDVFVVSKFSGEAVTPLTQIAPGVFAIPVSEPPRYLVDGLVAIKRVLRGRRQKRPLPEAAETIPGRSAAPSIAATLYQRFFAVIQAPDAQKKWSLLASRAALRATRGRDLRIVIASGPPFSSAIGARWLARLRKVPWLLDFRDPLAAGWDDELIRPSWVTGTLQRLEHSLITDATAVTCASPGIVRVLQAAYPEQAGKIELVMNGFDGDVQAARLATDNHLDIVFAGSLYLSRNPFPFLDALDALLDEAGVEAHRISVRFIGDCESYRSQRLADWLRGRRCEEIVQLIAPVSAAALAPLLARATVHLNLAQNQPNQIPAKTFEHLASGREMLVLCEADSDTGRILDGIAGATRVDPADTVALRAALRDFYSRHVVDGRARPPPQESVRQYSRAMQNQRFAETISRIVRL